MKWIKCLMSPPTSTVQVLWRWILRIDRVRLKSTRDCSREFCRKIPHRLVEVQVIATPVPYILKLLSKEGTATHDELTDNKESLM